MKARQIDGKITTYKILPETWDGKSGHIINFRNAPTEVLEAEGFYDVVKPAYDPRVDCLLYTSPSPRDQRGSRMAACA